MRAFLTVWPNYPLMSYTDTQLSTGARGPARPAPGLGRARPLGFRRESNYDDSIFEVIYLVLFP